MPTEVSFELPSIESIAELVESNNIVHLEKITNNLSDIIQKLEVLTSEEIDNQIFAVLTQSKEFLNSFKPQTAEITEKLNKSQSLEEEYQSVFEERAENAVNFQGSIEQVLVYLNNITDCLKQARQAEVSLSDLTKESAILSARKKAVSVSIETVNQQFDDAQEQLSQSEQDIHEYDKQLSIVKQKLETRKQQVVPLLREKDDLEFAITTTQTELDRVLEHKAKQTCQEQIVALSASLNSVNQKLDDRKARITALAEKCQILEKNIEIATNEHESALSARDNADTSLADFELKADSLNVLILENKKQLMQTKESLVRSKADTSNNQSFLSAELEVATDYLHVLIDSIKQHLEVVSTCQQFSYENSPYLISRMFTGLYNSLPSWSNSTATVSNTNETVENSSPRPA